MTCQGIRPNSALIICGMSLLTLQEHFLSHYHHFDEKKTNISQEMLTVP